MTEPFIFSSKHDQRPSDNTTDSISTFLEKHKDEFKVEMRYNTYTESVEVKARIFKTYDYFVDLEFASEEDAKLFYDNQDKVINLIILP